MLNPCQPIPMNPAVKYRHGNQLKIVVGVRGSVLHKGHVIVL